MRAPVKIQWLTVARRAGVLIDFAQIHRFFLPTTEKN
jgi:hypothetical protein